MDILTCSVSGGNFVSQLAGLYCLLKAGYNPNAILGASGGSVTIACLIYSQGNYKRIPLILSQFSCRQFTKDWVKSLPWWMIGPFQGSAYQHTYGILQVTNNYIYPAMINQYEIWILTYNQTHHKPHLFTNRSNESKISTQDSIVSFIGSDVDILGSAILASSCIPGVLPPVEINGEKHIDGGAYASSPISLVSHNLQTHSELHIVFLTGSYAEGEPEENKKRQPTIIDVTSTCVDALYRNSVRRDRIICKNLLSHYGKVIELDDYSLEKALIHRKKYKASFIEIFPTKAIELDITSFESDEAQNVFKDQIGQINCRYWIAV